jgi:glycosyl hydrolase family 57
MRLVPRGVILCILAVAFISALGLAEKAPLNLAIVWHQHQPMYWNRLTGEYELPWARIHGVQEYIDTAHISAEYPDIHVTFNLQPSLLWQLNDYATITPAEAALGGLYEHIGAIDNHLEWTWILATAPAQLSDEERTLAQEQFFWLNGYMFDDDTNDPYYDSHYAELNMLANAADLSDQQLLDAAALFLLWQTSPELH